MEPMTHRTEEATSNFPRAVARRLYAALPVLLPIVAFVITVYWDAFFSGAWLASGDNLPVWDASSTLTRIGAFCGDWRTNGLGWTAWARPFHPLGILCEFLPRALRNVVSFALSTCLVYFAALYWLRSHRGFRTPECVLAALWIAFSGYGFSLISAGHRPVFQMLPWAVFMFAFIVRAVRRRNVFYFFMVGMSIGWGMSAQPDTMAIFILIGAVYAAVNIMSEFIHADRRSILVRQIVLGGCVTLVVGALSSYSSLAQARRIILPQRTQQMGMSEQQKWIFATNWSLPPEDVIEFIAPCVFGIETGDPRAPYWGRLGQAYDWDETQQGFVNFRQHTVYLGLIPIVFLCLAFGSRARANPRDALERGGTPEYTRLDAIFWASVLRIALLLAMGRYLPFYRLFYALPFFSKIRGPVKFMHVVDLSVCLLFARGLQSLFGSANNSKIDGKRGTANWSERLMKNRALLAALIVSFSVTLLAVLAAMIVPGYEEQLQAHWSRLGLSRYSAVLVAQMRSALLHCGFLGTALTILLCYVALARNRHRWVLVSAISVLMLFDVATVCKKYIRVKSLDAYYGRSALAETIRLTPERFRLSYRATPMSFGNPLWMKFEVNDVQILEPHGARQPPADTLAFFETLGASPLRLWQLSSAGFILGQSKQFAPLLQHPSFKLISNVQLTNAGLTPTTAPSDYVFLRYLDALPRAALFHQWQSMTVEQMQDALVAPTWNPRETVLVNGVPNQTAGALPTDFSCEIIRYTRNRVTVSVDAKADGILLLNEKYDSDWRVTIDGKPATLLRCNSIMRGVSVPPGSHEVTFRYCPNMKGFLISAALATICAFWGLRRICKSGTRHGSQQGPAP